MIASMMSSKGMVSLQLDVSEGASWLGRCKGSRSGNAPIPLDIA